jgi:hypothetical protein
MVENLPNICQVLFLELEITFKEVTFGRLFQSQTIFIVKHLHQQGNWRQEDKEDD